MYVRMMQMGMRPIDLAERLGVSRAYVSQLLNGKPNMTMRTLVGWALALDQHVHIQLRPRAPRTAGREDDGPQRAQLGRSAADRQDPAATPDTWHRSAELAAHGANVGPSATLPTGAVGTLLRGTINNIAEYGVSVELEQGVMGFAPGHLLTQVAPDWPHTVQRGARVVVRVERIDHGGQMVLSIEQFDA
jgi:transcriptional regulator with XRE-family HTH domain